MTKLVEDDRELELKFLAVLVRTIHSVTARQGLRGGRLVVGVVEGGSQGELVEVLEKFLVTFFIIEGHIRRGGLQHGLVRGEEHSRDLESVVRDHLVEHEHHTIVLSLREQLTGTAEIQKVGSLTRMSRGDDAGVDTNTLLQSLFRG